MGKGALPHVPDERDYDYSKLGKASAPFDWSVGVDIPVLKIKNQGSSSSCGGQAWSYFMGKLKGDERSAKFIYEQTVAPGGGSDGRTNCDLVVKEGDCTEALYPSVKPDGTCDEAFMVSNQTIPPEAFTDALTDTAFSYAQVSIDFDSLAQAIRDNGGVILGVDGENNNSWTTAFPQPPVNIVWRHWLYFCKAKLVNGKKFLGCTNSWGDSVGENGVQWFDESWLPHIFVAWTLYTNSSNFVFNTDMMYNQTSPDIVQLQKRLGVNPTGWYGPITKAAVFAYQQSHLTLSWYEKYILRGNVCGQRTRTSLNGA